MLRLLSRFLRALFQFSKRAAGEATKFGRSGVEFLGVVGAACLECDEPAAEAGELIGRQLGDNFGDFFDFHVAQYSTAGRINLRPPMSALGGGLKRSTQHVMSDARVGVDGRWVEDISRVQRSSQGGVVEPLAVRIPSSTEWLGNSMNGRARLWASKPEPNET